MPPAVSKLLGKKVMVATNDRGVLRYYGTLEAVDDVGVYLHGIYRILDDGIDAPENLTNIRVISLAQRF